MAEYIKEIRELIGSRPLILVGATIIVKNDRNEILFQHRSDTTEWGLPGGAMEIELQNWQNKSIIDSL